MGSRSAATSSFSPPSSVVSVCRRCPHWMPRLLRTPPPDRRCEGQVVEPPVHTVGHSHGQKGGRNAEIQVRGAHRARPPAVLWLVGGRHPAEDTSLHALRGCGRRV